MKHIFLKFSWLPVMLLLTSCWKEPMYPPEPFITFNSISQQTVRDALNNPVAEITIATGFQDGDGDLGLRPDETDPPFHPVLSNKFRNNYFVETFIEQNGEFVPYVTAIDEPYNGRFMRLGPDDKKLALEGELRFSLQIQEGFDIGHGDKIKFRVQIADRKLNLSNTIETDPVILNFPR